MLLPLVPLYTDITSELQEMIFCISDTGGTACPGKIKST